MPEETVVLYLRVPRELRERLEALIDRMKAIAPYQTIKVNTVATQLLTDGIDRAESRLKGKKGGR